MLFADLSGFTTLVQSLGDEAAYHIVGDCLEVLASIAVARGGYLHQYEGDCVMVLFGAPTAVEHADRAAVVSAIEMRSAVAEFCRARNLARPLKIHTGINSGPMVAGQLRRHGTSPFDVIGDTVNIAARLKDAAPSGHIYVGPETYQETKDEFAYAPLPPMPLKGREGELPVYEVLSEEAPSRTARPAAVRRVSAPLVGRERETVEIQEAVTAGIRDGGRIVWITGEAGIGKSRLLADLGVSVGLRHVRFLTGRTPSIGQQLSFYPVAELLRDWSGVIEGEDPARATATIDELCRDLLPGVGPSVTPYLLRLMGIPLAPEHERAMAATAPDALERLLVGSVLSLLDALAQRGPLVLTFDDLHWADGSTLRFLRELLDWSAGKPVSVVLAMRPDHAETTRDLLAHATRAHASRLVQIALDPLAPDTMRNLVTLLLRSADVPRFLQDEIEARCGGNPFFAEEIIRVLIDRGALTISDSGLDVSPHLTSGDLPGTIHGVVMGRIDALPDAPRRLLQIASVIGRSFHHAVLEDIAGGPGSIDDALDALIDAEFIEPMGTLGARGYVFKHPLVQQIGYDAILESDRSKLHARVAESIEEHLSPQVPGYFGMLAYHHGQAGNLAEAEELLDLAGDAAAKMGAPDEAVHFFTETVRRVIGIKGEGADRERLSDLERKIALAHMNRGDLQQAVVHFDAALTLLGEGPPASRIEAARRLARTAARITLDLYAPGVRPVRPPATAFQQRTIELMYGRAQALTTANPKHFLRDTLTALGSLSRVDPATVARAGSMYASAIGIFSFGGVSFRISRRLLTLGERAVHREDPCDLLTYRLMAFLHHYLEGAWSDEHTVDAALLDESLSRGHLWEVTTYHNLEAAYRVFRGEFSLATQHLERLLKIADTYRYSLAASAHAGVSAYLALERRDLDAALSAAEHYLTRFPEPLFNIIAHGVVSKTHVLRGDLEAAAGAATEGAALVRKTPGVTPYHLNHVVCAALLLHVARLEAALRAGDTRERRRLVRETRSIVGASVRAARRFAARRPEVYRLAGTAAWLRGRRRAAIAWWERSIAEARRLGMRPELGRTQLEAARWLGDAPRGPVAGLDATALLDEASEDFTELGLAWDLAALERERR